MLHRALASEINYLFLYLVDIYRLMKVVGIFAFFIIYAEVKIYTSNHELYLMMPKSRIRGYVAKVMFALRMKTKKMLFYTFYRTNVKFCFCFCFHYFI